jgi:hypothetical protein
MMATAQGSRRTRRMLPVLALALVAVSVSTFWLADSGALALPQPAVPFPVGTGANGQIATFTALNPSNVTVPHDQGAQKIDGVLLGKVTVAAGFASRLNVNISWLNPNDAGRVLHSPKAWITFGLYYPIHTGVCTDGDPDGSKTLTDGSALCAALNKQATGTLVHEGELKINATMLTGLIIETATDPGLPSTCVAPPTPPTPPSTTWCAPSGLVNQNVFYVAASIDTPGDDPPGQQSQIGTLSFYIAARSN